MALSPAVSLFGSETALPAIQFWVCSLCMAVAAMLAPGAVFGIAAFPLFAIALVYGMKGFRTLPASRQRPRISDAIWFMTGLTGVLLFSVLHGAMAFAFTHPASAAVPPPAAFTLLAGLLPVALCIYA